MSSSRNGSRKLLPSSTFASSTISSSATPFTPSPSPASCEFQETDMNSNVNTTRHSILGRPRRLTDEQIADILEWHHNRKSYKQVARENGVSVNTIKYVIRINGEYKQCAPDERARITERRRRIMAAQKEHNVL